MRAFCSVQHPVSRGATVEETYRFPSSLLTLESLSREKEALTLVPKTFYGPPPAPLKVWHEDASGNLHVPRFYGLDRFGPPAHDERSIGDALPESLVFEGTLTEVQERASRACAISLEKVGGGILCLPCGTGKTVLAVHTIVSLLGRKACVFVHKSVIRDQWIDAFAQFCPKAKVRVLQGGKGREEDDDYDVLVAMILTVAKRDFAAGEFDAIGTLVVDECHHVAAPVMSRAVRKFRAKNVVGLTATKERADGMTPLLHWMLGPEAFRAERQGGEAVRVTVALFPGKVKEVTARTRNGKSKVLTAVMINELARNEARNAFLAERIVAMRRRGRVIIVLSDRKAQVEALKSLLSVRLAQEGWPEDALGVFIGPTKESDRQEQLSRPIVLCTYGMANEGLDKTAADTLVMATPKSRVVQCVGRIQRPCETKMSPLVLDVVDRDVPAFASSRWTRNSLYRKESYETQVLDVRTAANGDWFE